MSLESTTNAETGPSVVFVLGGPGSGKGTQCLLITQQFGYHHISAGDCLREERLRPGSAFGELIEMHIRNGTIVPVEVTCALLRAKMEQTGWKGGKFLIDGFPRNADNLQGWQKACGDVEVRMCLVFDCPEEVMEKRLLLRGETSGRSDDNIESIRKRFHTFSKETIPVIQHFEKQGKVRRICADGSREDVFKQVEAALA